TLIVTVPPGGTLVPAAGSVLTTVPDGTVSLGTCEIFGFRPAWVTAALAALWLCPVTDGTGMPGATATLTVIAVFLGTTAPAAGFVSITVPGVRKPFSVSWRFTVRPTLVMAAVALSMVWPFTSGTVALIELIVRTIVLPLSALRP